MHAELALGRGLQPPVEIVGPGVIRAHEGAAVARAPRGRCARRDAGRCCGRRGSRRPCPRERITESKPIAQVIQSPGLRDQAGMAGVEPMAAPDALHVGLEDVGRCIERPLQRPGAAIGGAQGVDLPGIVVVQCVQGPRHFGLRRHGTVRMSHYPTFCQLHELGSSRLLMRHNPCGSPRRHRKMRQDAEGKPVGLGEVDVRQQMARRAW